MKPMNERLKLAWYTITAVLLSVARLTMADPIIIPLPGGGGGGPVILPVETSVIHCASGRYRYNECHLRGRILDVRVVNQVSQAKCVRGRSFGVRDNVLYVDKGCRADFLVTTLCAQDGDLDPEEVDLGDLEEDGNLSLNLGGE